VRWVLLAALGVSLVALYGDVLIRLWRDWITDDNYSHGILVPPAIAWLLWRRRAALRAADIRPSYAGSLIVAVSLGMLITGHAAVEFFLTRLSLVGVAAGVVVQLAGWQHLRLAAFPLVLLVLAIPLPALLFNQIAFPLQLLASQFGVATLEAFAVPALREGNVIRLDAATLEVAEACSGVRSLVSLLTIVLFYGYIAQQGRLTRWMLALSILPIVIVANGLRVAGAGAAAHIYGAGAASGFLHTFSGWVFFGSSVVLLVAIERGVTFVSRRTARGTEQEVGR
jgi:exosortase